MTTNKRSETKQMDNFTKTFLSVGTATILGMGTWVGSNLIAVRNEVAVLTEKMSTTKSDVEVIKPQLLQLQLTVIKMQADDTRVEPTEAIRGR